MSGHSSSLHHHTWVQIKHSTTAVSLRMSINKPNNCSVYTDLIYSYANDISHVEEHRGE